MILLHNLIPMLVDADDGFIRALEAHLREHKNRMPDPEPTAPEVVHAEGCAIHEDPELVCDCGAIVDLGATSEAQATEIAQLKADAEEAEKNIAASDKRIEELEREAAENSENLMAASEKIRALEAQVESLSRPPAPPSEDAVEARADG